jgi:glutaredoxin
MAPSPTLLKTTLLVALLAGATGAACRKRKPPAPPITANTAPPRLSFSKESPLLYTYVDDKGAFVTTDKADDVPQASRRLVRVVDPSKPADNRQDTKVYALDLGELLASGKAEARVLSREAFETGALAQLPPGDSSPLAGPHGPALPDEPLPGVDGGVGAMPPVVILYGTPWCGACKAAKRYLASKHIPYAYKNIESDPAAARELQAKAARLGVPADRVPILDVRGRLLLGFDPARLDAMLGAPT